MILPRGFHPFPSRTRKLSPAGPMVLYAKVCGRLGRRRIKLKKAPFRNEWGLLCFVRSFLGSREKQIFECHAQERGFFYCIGWREFMKIVQARVTCKCLICGGLICRDCIRFGLGPPTDEICELPVRWLSLTCPHRSDGLRIELLAGSSETLTGSLPPGSLRWKEAEEVESPAWLNNLDFTKNWGFPCREQGRYGSHPSHDPFDDESNP